MRNIEAMEAASVSATAAMAPACGGGGFARGARTSTRHQRKRLMAMRCGNASAAGAERV